MKVLKLKEENDTLETIQVSCTGAGFDERGCGRLLAVTGLDIFKGYHDGDTYYYIRCCECCARTEVYHSSIKRGMFPLIKSR